MRERERERALVRNVPTETEKAEDHVVCCSSWKALHCNDKGGENPKIMRIVDVRTWTPATISPSLSPPSGFRSFSFWHRFASLGRKEKKKKRTAWRCFILVSTFALFFTAIFDELRTWLFCMLAYMSAQIPSTILNRPAFTLQTPPVAPLLSWNTVGWGLICCWSVALRPPKP